MICTWFEIYRDKNSQPIIFKMDAEGKAISAHPATNRVDAICHLLLSEPTAKTVLFADQNKPLPSIGASNQGGIGFTKERLATIAETEAARNYGWRVGGGAKIYTKKYEKVLGAGRFPWCAAFVTYCCDMAGLNLPINCPTGYTFALCEAWQQWAIKEKFYHGNDGAFKPARGDIVLFDWDQTKIGEPDLDWEDHIGIVIDTASNAGIVRIKTAEGNVKDVAGIQWRGQASVQGYIRITDGYKFA